MKKLSLNISKCQIPSDVHVICMKTHKIYYYGRVTASHLTQITVNFMLKAADLIFMKLHSHCVFVLTCTPVL